MCSETRTNERTLEVHTAVDITPFLVASWSQRPDKGVIVLHRAPALPKESNPVTAGPGMLGTDGVMAFNSTLWEVAAADIPELHFPGGFHGNK